MRPPGHAVGSEGCWAVARGPARDVPAALRHPLRARALLPAAAAWFASFQRSTVRPLAASRPAPCALLATARHRSCPPGSWMPAPCRRATLWSPAGGPRCPPRSMPVTPSTSRWFLPLLRARRRPPPFDTAHEPSGGARLPLTVAPARARRSRAAWPRRRSPSPVLRSISFERHQGARGG